MGSTIVLLVFATFRALVGWSDSLEARRFVGCVSAGLRAEKWARPVPEGVESLLAQRLARSPSRDVRATP